MIHSYKRSVELWQKKIEADMLSRTIRIETITEVNGMMGLLVISQNQKQQNPHQR